MSKAFHQNETGLLSVEKEALIIRLRKIKGQVEAIEKMVEAGANWKDTFLQVIMARRTSKPARNGV